MPKRNIESVAEKVVVAATYPLRMLYRFHTPGGEGPTWLQAIYSDGFHLKLTVYHFGKE